MDLSYLYNVLFQNRATNTGHRTPAVEIPLEGVTEEGRFLLVNRGIILNTQLEKYYKNNENNPNTLSDIIVKTTGLNISQANAFKTFLETRSASLNDKKALFITLKDLNGAFFETNLGTDNRTQFELIIKIADSVSSSERTDNKAATFKTSLAKLFKKITKNTSSEEFTEQIIGLFGSLSDVERNSIFSHNHLKDNIHHLLLLNRVKLSAGLTTMLGAALFATIGIAAKFGFSILSSSTIFIMSAISITSMLGFAFLSRKIGENETLISDKLSSTLGNLALLRLLNMKFDREISQNLAPAPAAAIQAVTNDAAQQSKAATVAMAAARVVDTAVGQRQLG